MNVSPISRLWWLTYPLWIIICGVLFVALRDMPDPSRPLDRLESDEAAAIALEHLRGAGGGAFDDYTVVHVAQERGESGTGQPRWVVIADEKGRSRLRNAAIVELTLVEGELIGIQRVDADRAMAGEPLFVAASGESRPVESGP